MSETENGQSVARAGAAPRILIGMADGPDRVAVSAALAARGWAVETAADGAMVVARSATGEYALLLLCGALPVLDGAALAARLARLPAPRNALPRVVMPTGQPLPPDAVLHRHILCPADTGTAPPGPLERLAPMFGTAAVVELFARFHDRLAAVLAADDPCAIGEGATPGELAHRLAGIAGLLDFGLLAAAWARVEQAGACHLPGAWIETRIACATLAILLDRRDDPPPASSADAGTATRV